MDSIKKNNKIKIVFCFPLCASGVFAPQLSQVQQLRKASLDSPNAFLVYTRRDTLDHSTFKSILSKHTCVSPRLRVEQSEIHAAGAAAQRVGPQELTVTAGAPVDHRRQRKPSHGVAAYFVKGVLWCCVCVEAVQVCDQEGLQTLRDALKDSQRAD